MIKRQIKYSNVAFIMATPSEVCQILGARLRQVRLSKNLTQKMLAEKCQLSLGTVKKLEESGQTTLLNFVRVASHLGLQDRFESLLAYEPTSIEQLEQLARQNERQRARKKGFT